ncbi:DUF1972 domain-containing protein [Chitinophaga sp. GbtcB8]|uniref:DUF1972 domain-containing protein n=1 Tax=Chitinophaga sp. GbtcB8 TaxID=2824753 RepID=UPI001C2F4EF6|nr:DUF1972 domain-containing protein [Chitinophaga sp. GbtcB8]
MSKKHVAIIGTVGIPAKYGGFETLTQNLVQHLKDDFDFTVYCSSKEYEKRLPGWKGVQLKYIPLKANGIQSIPYDILSFLSALRCADIILVLGVSGTIILPFMSKKTRSKTVINIDGLEWKRAKWNKRISNFLKYSEKLAVKYGRYIIADNEEIRKYITEEYKKDSALIAYGADHIIKKGRISGKTEQPYAFTVCRIEPENNIHVILEAFRESGRSIKIVGNWQLSPYSRKLYEQYSTAAEIELLPPIYDQEKLDALRANCRLYIHGHSAGGTNPSLVEAMYLGLPVIAFDVPYNRATTNNEALFFKDKVALIEILNTANDMKINAVAQKMKEIAQANYTWEKIARKYAEIFDKVLDVK